MAEEVKALTPDPSPTGGGEKDGAAALRERIAALEAENEKLRGDVAALEESASAREAKLAGKIIILRDTDEETVADYVTNGYSVQHMQFAQVEGRPLDVVLRRINGGPRDGEGETALTPESPLPEGEGEPETVYTYPVVEPEPEPIPAADGSHVAALTVFGLDDGPDVLPDYLARNFGGYFATRIAPAHDFTAPQIKAVMDGWHRWNSSVSGTVAS